MINITLAMGMETSYLDKPFEPYFKAWDIDTNFFPLTHLEFPVIMLLFYIFTVFYYQPPKKAKIAPAPATSRKTSKSSTTTLQRLAISLHNGALCIFSVLCFYNTAPN
eukprot:115411_1